MIRIAAFWIGSGLMFNVAATVPTYNIKPTCRAAIDLSGITGRTVEMCEASEVEARAGIVKGWSTFTESAKNPLPPDQRATGPKLRRAADLP